MKTCSASLIIRLLDPPRIDFTTTQLDYAAQAVQSNCPVILGLYMVCSCFVLEQANTKHLCGETSLLFQLLVHEVE